MLENYGEFENSKPLEYERKLIELIDSFNSNDKKQKILEILNYFENVSQLNNLQAQMYLAQLHTVGNKYLNI